MSSFFSRIFANTPNNPWGGTRKPGSGGNGGGGDQHNGGGRPNQHEPDLDDMLRQAQDKLNSIFGGGNKGGAGGGIGGSGLGAGGIGIVVALLAALWLSTGFYRVLPEENAVILTFGKWTDTRAEPGLGYHIPWPIQEVTKVNVAFDRRVEVGFREKTSRSAEKTNIATESQMLTGDENIVDIDFVVMWRIADAGKFLFKIRDPETTIKKVSESAMREVIGRSPIQKALTEGRADIEASAKTVMQGMLDEYQSGISVNSVQLLRVDPPAPVVDAFDDVQRARADKERAKNEAETYRNDIVPRARGEAQKLVQDAEAYKEAVISKAKGEAGRFESVYAAYAVAKDVTNRRLYIETMQQVMQGSQKVIVGDSKTSNILPYLPLGTVAPTPKAPVVTPPQPAPAQ